MDRGKRLSQDKIAQIKNWLGTGSINIFGIQFSGKDTQGRFLADLFQATLIGGGDILRSSEVSESIRNALAVGKYIDSKEYLRIMLPYFSRKEFENHPLILSSVGRWVGEETSVLTAAESSGHPIKAAIHLLLDEAEAFKRLDSANRGRDDDHHENLTSRINEFKTKTLPVIDVYRQRGLLIEINGNNPPNVVLSEIIDALYQAA